VATFGSSCNFALFFGFVVLMILLRVFAWRGRGYRYHGRRRGWYSTYPSYPMDSYNYDPYYQQRFGYYYTAPAYTPLPPSYAPPPPAYTPPPAAYAPPPPAYAPPSYAQAYAAPSQPISPYGTTVAPHPPPPPPPPPVRPAAAKCSYCGLAVQHGLDSCLFCGAPSR
jgi:hypothetical protein